MKDTQRVQLLKDRCIVLLRESRPLVKRRRTHQALLAVLRQLELVAVRTHADTLRMLELLQLEDRLRLTTEHFMVLPSIVKAADLAVVMRRNIAQIFCSQWRLRHHRAVVSAARLRGVAALEQTLFDRTWQPVVAWGDRGVIQGIRLVNSRHAKPGKASMFYVF